MTSISFLDFKRPDGTTDWKAYNLARRNRGEICQECGSFILFAKGRPDICAECKTLETDTGEVHHDCMIRCPHCGHRHDVNDIAESTDYDVYREGERDMDCHECEKEFSYHVNVSYSYTSPELVSQEDDEDDES